MMVSLSVIDGEEVIMCQEKNDTFKKDVIGYFQNTTFLKKLYKSKILYLL